MDISLVTEKVSLPKYSYIYILCRVPEIVYQPSMLGIEQAGIAETIDFILNHFSAELQASLVQVQIKKRNVFNSDFIELNSHLYHVSIMKGKS